ncbi:arginine--tRNA ligase [Candidatus Njordibacter sp. Uisw_002]|jgi:arginyl-tRNA synthetase|uniref:arginine--tRNA ligase n=1 Tax=Candidatus Njordibacter sp. Uisw_002 TaxID=3230971 RepID=UPI003D3C30AE|tara:strand:- start:10352 stop:12109 length:1758 start_codon:yes stop_codon:yes gene_type:complete
MKQHIADLIQDAIDALKAAGEFDADLVAKIQIDNTKDKQHGDFACNVALTLAKVARRKPRDIAQLICSHLPASASVTKTQIAGPGFINFFISQDATQAIIGKVLEEGEKFGRNNSGAGHKVQVEFVSANPTGPLHVGHGRGAAYGASVSNLLEASGYEVEREYYVNDAGRQMNILAASVWLRYLQQAGEDIVFPSNGYQGAYVKDIAEQLHQSAGDRLKHSATQVMANLHADGPEGDKEKHIDDLIARAKDLLGESDYWLVFDAGLDSIRDDIKQDLHGFGVDYQHWFSERSLDQDDQINRAIKKLQEQEHVYEDGGALWFRSTAFGDDKDRVVKRDNGQTTYFASDIAYHLNKFERGMDTVINVWGADHHGYITRVKAALEALGIDPKRLVVKLVQFAILYRGEERVQMSTRSGSFVTLRELREEVGKDASRFFYVTRKSEQHMDFDLELAKTESKDNPVYYIQYAHARICTLINRLAQENMAWDSAMGLKQLEKLKEAAEITLMQQIALYPEVLANAASNHEPHQIAHYLKDLAGNFHSYYNAHRMVIDDVPLRNARMCLCMAARQVMANGLDLLGVDAPEHM